MGRANASRPIDSLPKMALGDGFDILFLFELSLNKGQVRPESPKFLMFGQKKASSTIWHGPKENPNTQVMPLSPPAAHLFNHTVSRLLSVFC